MASRHLIMDVQYDGEARAIAAGLVFGDWRSDTVEAALVVPIAPVAPYRSGRFFERELPCLLAVVDAMGGRPDTVVIDGYVHLGDPPRAGLGQHLFEALGGAVPVIGIAKTRFFGTPDHAALYRGQSKTPLFVTAAGMEAGAARNHVASMHGAYRLPTLARRVDHLCRGQGPDGG